MSLRMTRGQIERHQRREAVKFSGWKTEALAELKKRSGSNVTMMSEREWKRLFVRGDSPEEAARVAETYQHNVRMTGRKK